MRYVCQESRYVSFGSRLSPPPLSALVGMENAKLIERCSEGGVDQGVETIQRLGYGVMPRENRFVRFGSRLPVRAALLFLDLRPETGIWGRDVANLGFGGGG